MQIHFFFLYSSLQLCLYESAFFSIAQHLDDDQQNRMLTDLIVAELKIRLKSCLSRIETYDFLMKNIVVKTMY